MRTWLPVDWKVYARIALGILSVNQLNKAFDKEPPPWLRGVEAVAAITSMMQKFSKASLLQTAILAPIVGLEVQLASWLNQRIAKPLDDRYHIPPVVTGLGLAALFTGAGFRLYPKLWETLTQKGILSKSAQAEMMASAGMATICPRGCSPGSLICLSEAGEFIGGVWNHWFSKTPKTAEGSPS